MGGETLSTIARLLRMVDKPTIEEYKLMLRVVLLGLGLLGTVGFFFQLLGSFLEFASIGALPKEYTLFGGIIVIAATLALALYLRSREKL